MLGRNPCFTSFSTDDSCIKRIWHYLLLYYRGSYCPSVSSSVLLKARLKDHTFRQDRMLYDLGPSGLLESVHSQSSQVQCLGYIRYIVTGSSIRYSRGVSGVGFAAKRSDHCVCVVGSHPLQCLLMRTPTYTYQVSSGAQGSEFTCLPF